MKYRFVARLLKISRLAILFVGFSATISANAAEELRFSWWGTAPRHEATLKVIKQFEEKNPGVVITGAYGGFEGYQTRIATFMAGGTEPDIMQLNWAWVSQLSRDGNAFYDLNKSRNLIKMSDFSADELQMNMVKGKLNALSAGFTARVFFWNKESFTKAGLKMPTTWEELFATAKQYRAKTENKGYLMDGGTYELLLLTQTYIAQKYGTSYIDPVEPKVAMSEAALLEWTTMAKRLIDEHVVVPLPHRVALGSKSTEQNTDWIEGRWAGIYTWDSAINALGSTMPSKGQELDIGPFLALKEAKNRGIFGRPAMVFAVSKHSKYPQTAVKFLNYMLTDPEAGRILAMTRGIPASDAITNMLLNENRVHPNERKILQFVRDLKKAGGVAPPNPLFEHPRLQALILTTFEQLAYGRVTPEEAAKTLLIEGNLLLEKIR